MDEREASDVEVWLTLDEERSGVIGRAILDDETAKRLPVDARSIRGAEREVTALLTRLGYEATGYWEVEADERDEALEVSRTFKAVGPNASDLEFVWN